MCFTFPQSFIDPEIVVAITSILVLFIDSAHLRFFLINLRAELVIVSIVSFPPKIYVGTPKSRSITLHVFRYAWRSLLNFSSVS